MDSFEAFYNTYAMYLWAGLAGLVTLLALWMLSIQIRSSQAAARYRELTQGIDQGNLDDALSRQAVLLDDLSDKADRVGGRLELVERRVAGAIQKIGIVRFNPFNDTGGDQSFSIALLDGRGDGLLITSLFSRSATRVFAKPVQNGESKYPVSEEEAKAIQSATDYEAATPTR